MKKIKFKIIVPSYNSVLWIGKTLDSIACQTYRNFDVCVIDDASTLPGQREIISKFCKRKRWQKIFNPTRLGVMHNLVNGVAALKCDDADVIAIVDGDDWLYDENVLDKVAQVYLQGDFFLTYCNYMSEPPEFTGNPNPLPDLVVMHKLYRNFPFIFSHLKTFKYILWRHLHDEDLRDEKGDYFRAGADLVMWPLAEMAGNKFTSIDEILYVYNTENPLNDFKQVQDEVDHVRELFKKRPKYATLECCL